MVELFVHDHAQLGVVGMSKLGPLIYFFEQTKVPIPFWPIGLILWFMQKYVGESTRNGQWSIDNG